MPRSLLLPGLLFIASLALAGIAHAAAEPARHSADGSGCPEEAAAAPDEAATAPPGPTRQADAPGKATAGSRPSASEHGRVRLRWHAFVPGMFK